MIKKSKSRYFKNARLTIICKPKKIYPKKTITNIDFKVPSSLLFTTFLGIIATFLFIIWVSDKVNASWVIVIGVLTIIGLIVYTLKNRPLSRGGYE